MSKREKKNEILFKRYVWLVDLIFRSGKINRADINAKWISNPMSEGKRIPLRTFHNHREAISDLFEVDIECDKRFNEYYIANAEDINSGGVRTWLLNTFAVNNLINESHSIKDRILFEQIPSGQQYLAPLVEAMRDGKAVEITYQSYWSDKENTFDFEPYFVKVFKQRWYVIGKSDKVRIYSLDRIKGMKTNKKKFTLPKDFDTEAYFYNCYGIITGEDIKAQTIKIKVSNSQSNYLMALPLHHSQKLVEKTEAYSIFEFYIKPTYDFTQELLWQAEGIEILSPVSYRDEFARILKEMYQKYQS